MTHVQEIEAALARLQAATERLMIAKDRVLLLVASGDGPVPGIAPARRGRK